jgi:hypothetical protein
MKGHSSAGNMTGPERQRERERETERERVLSLFPGSAYSANTAFDPDLNWVEIQPT